MNIAIQNVFVHWTSMSWRRDSVLTSSHLCQLILFTCEHLSVVSFTFIIPTLTRTSKWSSTVQLLYQNAKGNRTMSLLTSAYWKSRRNVRPLLWPCPNGHLCPIGQSRLVRHNDSVIAARNWRHWTWKSNCKWRQQPFNSDSLPRVDQMMAFKEWQGEEKKRKMIC